MDEKRVRIADIAEELGVSTATVSNVIHGKTAKISERTVKRVQAALEERQYIPSMAGILLAKNNSRIVGVMINDHEKYERRVLQDPFIAGAIDYLNEELEKAGYYMMIKTAASAKEIVEFASMWNMDGAVMIGFCEQDYGELREHMRIPFVVYDGYFKEEGRCGNIIVDNGEGGRKMGEYLLSLGHRNILCISDNEICMDQERWLGLLSAVSGCEGARAHRLIVPFKKEERMELYQERLPEIMEYTAVFAVSDAYAIELMHFLQKEGIAVPEEISIAGFDDISQCVLTNPELCSVRQDGSLRAKMALEMLRELREGGCVQTRRVLPVTLQKRESVGRAPRR